MKITWSVAAGGEVLLVNDSTTVPRVGEDVEIDETGYDVVAVIWLPEHDEVEVRLR